MSNCNHDCSSCSEKCSKESFILKQNASSRIKHVIGVMSGKGGVGKSSVTSMLAVAMQRKGYITAVLDADITGPSIPRSFGLKSGSVVGNDLGMLPSETDTGIKVMSINLLMDNETDPVVWRGPVIAGTVKQFWTDVVWGDVDYMFVDMPPGTGDVPLTVFQSLPVDGIVIVTSPQELVSMIVEKAYNMTKLMDIEVLGIIENYSYIICPDCGKVIRPYGNHKAEFMKNGETISTLAYLPIDPKIAEACDGGTIEKLSVDYLDGCADFIEKRFK